MLHHALVPLGRDVGDGGLVVVGQYLVQLGLVLVGEHCLGGERPAEDLVAGGVELAGGGRLAEEEEGQRGGDC